MSKIPLAIVGCGGMGHRHMYGLAELHRAGLNQFDLIGACDPVLENAESLADQAAEHFGKRPTVVGKMDELVALGVKAVDITTTPRFHHALAVQAIHHGFHAMIEKPVGLTVRASNIMRKAAADKQLVMSVAENYRRDPINRLAKALITGGVLGMPYLSIQSSSGGGERVAITPWRHLRARGGIIVDMGIHYADLQEYYLGPIAQVVGMNALIDHQRTDAQGQLHPSDSEDVMAGVARFQGGAILHYLMNYAGRGEGHFVRTIHGTGGSLAIPSDRTGNPLRLTLRRQQKDEAIPESELLALVPDFALDDLTAALFGGERLSSYQMPFPDIDANLLGIEQAEFVDAIVTGREPEVTGLVGLRALGLMMGFLESELLGRLVTMDELLTSDAMPYEASILAAGRP